VSAGVVNHVSVIAIGLGVIALSVVTNEFMLMAIWVVLGVSRGLIRVTSATVVAEERERPGANVGLASGIYNAGLDAGGVFGPPLAGALAAALGIPTTFQLVAVVMLSLYYLIWFTQRAATRRNQSASPNPGLP
jgi:predicted MFS family arabinose efflux permease